MRFAGAVLILFLAAAVARAQVQPQTVSKVGTPAPNAVTVQSSPGAPLAITGSFSATTTEASVTSTGNNVPAQATYIGGSSSGGKLLAPYVMTSTPSGAEPGLVVRMPAGASGLTDAELRATPVPVSGSFSAVEGSVTSTGNNVPAQATFVGGVDAAGKLRGLTMTTSTPAASDLGLVVRTIGSTSIGASIGVTQSSTPWLISGPVQATVTSTTITGSVAVTGPLTNAEARASPLPVQATVTSTTITGSVAVTGPVTNAEMRASPLPVQATVTSTTITGSVAVTGTFWQATQPVSGTVTASGPLTNAELRASPVGVQATVTSTTITGSVAVTGPLTDAQLRASPFAVSSTPYGSDGNKLATANTGRLQVDIITGGGSNASVGTTSSTVPGSATYIGGSNPWGTLTAPFVMTSTPAGTEPGLVVRMPAGATGLTNSELRGAGAPIYVSMTSTTLGATANVNCVGGCAAAADTVSIGGISAACGPMNSCAASSSVTSTLTGAGGCGFNITATSTLVGTIYGDYSIDNGTTFVTSTLLDASGNATTSLTTAASTPYNYSIAVAGGARLCRVRASAVTSGAANVTVVTTAATSIGNTVLVYGTDTPTDTHANPTDALDSEAYNLGYNGTTWDRLRSIAGSVATGTLLTTDNDLVTARTYSISTGCTTAQAKCGTFATTTSTAPLEVTGHPSAAFLFTAGCSATMGVDASFDGGSTWDDKYVFWAASSSPYDAFVTSTNPGAGTVFMMAVPPGASHVRTRAVAYTSGTCTVTARANNAQHNLPVWRLKAQPVRCALTAFTSTATTSTMLTGCEVWTGYRYLISSVTFSSNVASTSANYAIIQSGTGTTCSSPAIRTGAYTAANGGFHANYDPPIATASNEGLCFLHAATGSKAAIVTGWRVPN